MSDSTHDANVLYVIEGERRVLFSTHDRTEAHRVFETKTRGVRAQDVRLSIYTHVVTTRWKQETGR